MFKRYKSRLTKLSLYIYSTPKYNARHVRIKTKEAANKAKLSIQKMRCESIKSRQKNHRPKSIK